MTCDIWQHTNAGKLSGYSGNLDFDILYNKALLVAPPAAETPKETTVQIELKQLRKGSGGAQVETMQTLHIEKFGISCGPDGADGKFGANTEKAVREFQKKKGWSWMVSAA